MKDMKRLAVALLLLFACPVVQAECDASGCTGFVDQVYVEANGGLWLQTSGTETLASCTPDSGVYLRLPGESAKFKEVYALLLTAQAMGWQVRVRIVDGTSPCEISYVYMNRQ